MKTSLFEPDFKAINNTSKKNYLKKKENNKNTQKINFNVKQNNYVDMNKINIDNNEKLKKYLNEEELRNFNPNFKLDISISPEIKKNKKKDNFISRYNDKKNKCKIIEKNDTKKLAWNKINKVKYQDKIKELIDSEEKEKRKFEKKNEKWIELGKNNNINYQIKNKKKSIELKNDKLFDKNHFLNLKKILKEKPKIIKKNNFIKENNDSIEDIKTNSSFNSNNESIIEDIEEIDKISSDNISFIKNSNTNSQLSDSIVEDFNQKPEEEETQNEKILKNISANRSLDLNEKNEIKEKIYKEIKNLENKKRKNLFNAGLNYSNLKKIRHDFEKAYYNRQIEKSKLNIKDIKSRINNIKKYI